MQFQFRISLTEEDYLAFNVFHLLESKTGKNTIQTSRFAFTCIMAVMAVLSFLLFGKTVLFAVIAAVLGALVILYCLTFEKFARRNMRAHIKRLTRSGKPPYDPVVELEFYEDRLVEITENKQTEQRYADIERICVVEDRYLFLYENSIGAYILPVPQLKAQTDPDDFLYFISSKCNNIEHYAK